MAVGRILGLGVRGLLVLGVLVTKVDASAGCSPYLGAVSTVIPSTATYPANARLIIDGVALQHDGFVATIDDRPAELVLNQSLSVFHDTEWGYHPVVMGWNYGPSVGSRVVIQGDPCYYFGALDEPCGFRVEYVVGEEDWVDPVNDLEWWWDYLDEGPSPGDPYLADLCTFATPVSQVQVSVRPSSTMAEPLLVEVVGTSMSGQLESFKDVRVLNGEALETLKWVFVPAYSSPPEEQDLCLTMRVYDVALNVSTDQVKCAPCRIAPTNDAENAPWCYAENRSCPADLEALATEFPCAEPELPDAGAPLTAAEDAGGAFPPTSIPSVDASNQSDGNESEPDTPAPASDDDGTVASDDEDNGGLSDDEDNGGLSDDEDGAVASDVGDSGLPNVDVFPDVGEPGGAVDASTRDSSADATASDRPSRPLLDSADASTGTPSLRGAAPSASSAGCDCRLSAGAPTPSWLRPFCFALVALVALYRRSARGVR